MAGLNTSVQYIKGIGEARAKALEKLGITTLRELIGFFPRRYEDRSVIYPIAELPVGETACCQAMIAGAPTSHRITGGRTVVKVRAVDDTGVLDVTFFNQAYRQQSLHVGESFVFCGKVEGNLLRRQMVNPLMEPSGQHQLTGRIMPVYPLTRGVSQLLLQKAMRQGLDECRELMPDVLPDRLESGTHNMPGIAGLLEGIRYVQRTGVETIAAHERRLTAQAVELLRHTEGIRLFWREGFRHQTGVLSFVVDGVDCEELGEAMARQGVALRAGLHCAPLAHESAGTLETGTFRVSFGPDAADWQTDALLTAVRRGLSGQHETG